MGALTVILALASHFGPLSTFPQNYYFLVFAVASYLIFSTLLSRWDASRGDIILTTHERNGVAIIVHTALDVASNGDCTYRFSLENSLRPPTPSSSDQESGNAANSLPSSHVCSITDYIDARGQFYRAILERDLLAALRSVLPSKKLI